MTTTTKKTTPSGKPDRGAHCLAPFADTRSLFVAQLTRPQEGNNGNDNDKKRPPRRRSAAPLRRGELRQDHPAAVRRHPSIEGNYGKTTPPSEGRQEALTISRLSLTRNCKERQQQQRPPRQASLPPLHRRGITTRPPRQASLTEALTVSQLQRTTTATKTTPPPFGGTPP